MLKFMNVVDIVATRGEREGWKCLTVHENEHKKGSEAERPR